MIHRTKQAQSVKAKAGRKLLVIDGTSFCYRAYYAIRSLANSKGEPTNAIYGFITMIRKLIQDEAPDYLAICFDRKEPTFRHEKFKDYKAHRKPMPDDLVEQLEPIKEFCRAYRYPLFEKAGFEADDIIGTLAVQGEKDGLEVFIVTGDKDVMQLVTEHVKIINPHRDDVVYDAEKVKKKFEGLGPDKIVDLMALMGDASDNIPGVPGIGEKTAVKLIQQFGSVENLISQANQISSKSQRAMIQDHSEEARLSKELAKIDVNVPLDYQWGDMVCQDPDRERLVRLLTRYEFKTLLKEQMPTGEAKLTERRYRIIKNEKDLQELIHILEKAEAFSFDTETTSSDSMQAHLVGLSFSWKEFEAAYVPVSSEHHHAQGMPQAEVLGKIRPLLENGKFKKYGQNIKYDWIVMKRHGVTLRGVVFDSMIASYLINPLRRFHNLDDLALEYLSVKKITTESLIGKGKNQQSMADVPVDQIGNYACEDADCVMRLQPILNKRLDELGLTNLYQTVELPLMEVLAIMEMHGVALDVGLLKKLSDDMAKNLSALTEEIYREAGEEFNINSTKQLGDILFVKMKLPVIKRTKTGYSTDEGVLEKLSMTYELPKRILEYREQAKLKSTYLDALPQMIHPETGYVHTSYNQVVTATGRLSSSEPNLQNIPVKTETGRQIRKTFISRSRGDKHGKIVSADYSQIELRILAHLSEDRNLVDAFQHDRDVHKFTATLLYGVSENDVTREMRDVAKTINFSIIYGKTAYGLSQDLGISVSEADGFIKQYFSRYPAIHDYLESQKQKARQVGYLTTILGRRSYFPDILSRNMQVRQFAERAAVNAPIQGSAADLIKLAMIAVQKRMERESVETLMIMQVHDELVFDVPAHEADKMTTLVREEMEGVYQLRVPLKADTFVGDSWYKD